MAAGAGLLVASLTGSQPLLPIAGALLGVAMLMPSFRRSPRGDAAPRRRLPAAVFLRGVLTFSFFSVDAFVALLLVTCATSRPPAGIALLPPPAWTTGSWVQARRQERWGAGSRSPGVPDHHLRHRRDGTDPAAVRRARRAAIVTWGLAGLGMGFAYSTFAIVVLRDAPKAEQGAATSALQLSDVLGTALGRASRAPSSPRPTARAASAWGSTAVVALGVGSGLVGIILARRIPA